MLISFLTRHLFIQVASADIGVNLVNPLNGATSSIPELISRFFTALVWLAAIIAPIFIIYGAFQILTSGGNAEKLGAGKKTILYTVIGFLIVLGAKGIVDIVKTALSLK